MVDLTELLSLGAGENLEYDRSKTVVDLIVGQAGKTPDAVAVSDSAGSLTYKDLDVLSNILASWLVEEKGVRSNDFVAVLMPRVKEFAVAALGIWKAGAAYVPIDMEYPDERKRAILEDCGAAVTISRDLFPLAIKSEGVVPSVNFSTPKTLAYMIYTSGSTGRPKGVMIGHAGLLNYVHSTIRINGIVSEDRVSAYRSFSFDSHIEEFYPSLAVGAQVHIVPDDIRLDLDRVAAFFKERGVPGLTIPTAVGMELLNSCDLSLDCILLGGEKLLLTLKRPLRLINEYVPTFSSTSAIAHRPWYVRLMTRKSGLASRRYRSRWTVIF